MLSDTVKIWDLDGDRNSPARFAAQVFEIRCPNLIKLNAHFLARDLSGIKPVRSQFSMSTSSRNFGIVKCMLVKKVDSMINGSNVCGGSKVGCCHSPTHPKRYGTMIQPSLRESECIQLLSFDWGTNVIKEWYNFLA